MTNNITLLFLMLLVLATSGFAQQAPEASASEAKGLYKNVPVLKKAFISPAPAHRKDGLGVGKLDFQDGDQAKVLKLAQEIGNNIHGKYDGLIISHKNKLVLEAYYRKGRVNLPHQQASVAKGYTALALGRAIQLGYLTMADLDKPLIGFLKDLDPKKLVKGAEKITLHKAMTMRSGMRLSLDQRKALAKKPQQLKGQGLVQAWLSLSKPITAKSQTYSYGLDPDLVMQVIEAVVPGSAQDFIKKELLDKMGITNYHWKTGISGIPEARQNAYMTLRDMVKWGKLVLNQGNWNGEQLIPAVFIAKATSPITQAAASWQPKNYHYGYYWYQTNIKVGGKNYSANMAWGGGGQHLIVIKALDLIVTITGYDMEDTIMNQVAKVIVPAFAKEAFPPAKDRYLGQKPPSLTPQLFAPDIIKTPFREAGAAFSPDLKEFYFRRRGGKYKHNTLVMVQHKDNRWVESLVARKAGEPFISPDGKTLHLGRRYRERTKDGWSELKSLDAPFKDMRIMRLTTSAKGTYYFDEASETGPLHYSRLIDGKHEKPKKVEVDAGKWNAHPFIAPDESYLIWDDQRNGNADLYISFRQKDGSWGAAINLGDKINTEANEAYGSVTPDGKYFFFHRSTGGGNADIYWVDVQVIENLRPKK